MDKKQPQWTRFLSLLWLKFDRQSLTVKLFIAMGAGFILLVSAGTFMLERVSNKAIAEIAVTRALYQSQLVKSTLSDYMSNQDWQHSDSRNFFNQLLQDNEIESVSVFDTSNIIVLSSHPEKMGETVQIEAAAALWNLSDKGFAQFSQDPGHQKLHMLYPIKVGSAWTGGVELYIPLTRLYHKFFVSRVTILTSALVLILLGAVIIRWLVVRIVKRPIKKLMHVIDKAGQGELDIRSHIYEDPELRRLAIRFNGLVRKIKQANDEIEAQHHKELSQANRLASLGQYISNISHEIKNPLAAICAALQVIKKDIAESDNAEVFEEVQLKIKHIERTVEHLLRYARQAPPVMAVCSMKKIIRDTLNIAQHQMEMHSVQAVIEMDKNVMPVYADAGQLQQVFLNLFLNAVYAMPHGGKITVRGSISEKQDQVQVEVRDTGAGIAEEHLKNIFEPFFSTRSGGTGLGLFVAKGILEAHEGSLGVMSKLNEGTIFRIQLPIRKNADEKKSGLTRKLSSKESARV